MWWIIGIIVVVIIILLVVTKKKGPEKTEAADMPKEEDETLTEPPIDSSENKPLEQFLHVRFTQNPESL